MATFHCPEVSVEVLPDSEIGHSSLEIDTPPNFDRGTMKSTAVTSRSEESEKNGNSDGIDSPSRKSKRESPVCASSNSLTKDSVKKPNNSALSESAWSHGIEIVFEYNIDPYDHSDEVLMDCAIIMFHAYDLFSTFKFTESMLRVFMEQVRKFYNPENLFHNFKHVWSVMHMCFSIMYNGADQYLESMDIFAVLISALCHDLHHPGNNNAFEVATDSELSKMYSFPDETCVLEHHHAQSTHKLLISEEQELCRGLSRFQREEFFKLVEFIILGTDMEKHTKLLAEAESYTKSKIEDSRAGECRKKARTSNSNSVPLLSEMVSDHADNFPSSDEPPSSLSERTSSGNNLHILLAISGPVDKRSTLSRMCFTRVLVHAADIGAQTQGKDVAYKWMQRCYGEFRSQANKERGLGIMTSAFLHDLQEDYKTYASQYSFIAGTVEPLWTALAKYLPKLQFAVDQLIENKIGYQRMLEDYHKSNDEGNSSS